MSKFEIQVYTNIIQTSILNAYITKMMNKFKKIATLFCSILSITAFAQFGQMPPFSIQLEPITGIMVPGTHSFAFAQSGDKWLIIGGRINGLHGLNSNGSFEPEFANNSVIVIDTTTWQSYSASLNQLSRSIVDPIRSTNMQSIHEGNYLYMVGGYGYDSVNDINVTFKTLTAIHVDNMINAVMNAQPIGSFIRQIADTNLAICGGDLGKIGNDYYLCFGHNFEGNYNNFPSPLFTQKYSDRIKKFNITDDGTTITLSNFSYNVDTNNFHRRDLNVGPIVKPNGSFALEAYGGVFQKDKNIPFREPITIEASGTSINFGYQQVMSHYTCASIPVFDSASGTMYNTFLGGISLYNYFPATHTVSVDSLVPFIQDVTTMTTHANGTVEETVLPTQLSAKLGTNAKFVLNENTAHYSNDVIKIRALPNSKTLIGYMYGGIRAQDANFGGSSANDTIYRVYMTPNNSSIGIEEISLIQNALLYPNPASQYTIILFTLKNEENIQISLQDITGKEIMIIADEKMQAGNQQLTINTSKLSAGIYLCKIQSDHSQKYLKLVIRK